MITLTGVYAQIIADCLEDGYGLRMTTNMVNEYCRSQNLPSFTIGPVHTAFGKLKPKVCRVKKRPQGSTDPNAPWSRARLNWVTQLLVRFGMLKSSELGSLIDPVTGELPEYFDKDKLTRLLPEQVAWFDETEKAAQRGGARPRKQPLFEYGEFDMHVDGGSSA